MRQMKIYIGEVNRSLIYIEYADKQRPRSLLDCEQSEVALGHWRLVATAPHSARPAIFRGTSRLRFCYFHFILTLKMLRPHFFNSNFLQLFELSLRAQLGALPISFVNRLNQFRSWPAINYKLCIFFGSYLYLPMYIKVRTYAHIQIL